ncbi:ACP S-malonyltransferase [Nitrosomonas communis]|uniref:Malonyl CoA-acyl carrier protein transacylase n=1 Tax=Nitrosomonas communis TaxID=44574 RepID=A0A1I4MYA7_9PROT|nr:ACP S-malonyltransferase [Nitrosomonas communis]SFM08324.1 [acyl-carrier-protein] S-malonyltransferase [Nitrosomonas communis]
MKIAFVFPGQGSQSVGMMKGYADLPLVHETFSEAGDILKKDLWSLVNQGPVEDLNLTVNTQPAMLTAGIAVYRAWENLGGKKPNYLAGHSLAEYTALVISGALAFSDALNLVSYRAKIMQECVPEGVGVMAAIVGLDDDEVRAICVEIMSSCDGMSLEPANFNSPSQVVIAGHKNAVQYAMELSKAKGAKLAILLPMSIPSHCSLMRPAAEKMRQLLEKISFESPTIPIMHNVDVQQHHDAASIREILAKQLYSPVRWTETIRAFASAGVDHVVECGPGKVLTGLTKRIDGKLKSLSLTDSNALRQTIDILK